MGMANLLYIIALDNIMADGELNPTLFSSIEPWSKNVQSEIIRIIGATWARYPYTLLGIISIDTYIFGNFFLTSCREQDLSKTDWHRKCWFAIGHE